MTEASLASDSRDAMAPPVLPEVCPVVFLVNQISGHGHLDTYAKLYSACLLELGFEVVLLAERETGIGDWIEVHRPELASNFRVRCNLPALSLMERFRAVRRAQGLRKALVRSLKFVLRYAPELVGKLGRPSRELKFSIVPVVNAIRQAEDDLDQRAAVVFFLYLDVIAETTKDCLALEHGLAKPWTGILFHPRGMHGSKSVGAERYLHCRNVLGVAFLNPHAVAPYARLFPPLQFVELPDITDDTLTPSMPTLSKRVRERAANRTIVLLTGSLSVHKGVMPLIDVIRAANPREFFFAIVGEIFWDTFGAHQRELRSFVANPPENCLIFPGYQPDERQLNAVIETADILYAVYRDQRDSSNTLTKAAIFEKPIVVSGAHLMGERVRQYSLGWAVENDTADEILAALQTIRTTKGTRYGFAAYRRDHSLEKLKEGLRELLRDYLPAEEALKGLAGTTD